MPSGRSGSRRGVPDRDVRKTDTSGELGCLLLIGLVVWFFFFRHREKAPEIPGFEQQVEILRRSQEDLARLRGFLDSQSVTLAQRESLVVRRQAQVDSLRPVVEADRRAIDGVLTAAAQREKRNKWFGTTSGPGRAATLLRLFLSEARMQPRARGRARRTPGGQAVEALICTGAT